LCFIGLGQSNNPVKDFREKYWGDNNPGESIKYKDLVCPAYFHLAKM